MTRDVYTVLGVDPGVSHEELSNAFRSMATELHPDRHAGESVATQDQMAARMAEVTNAWRQVSTPEKRHAYDLVRAERIVAPRSVPPTVRSTGPGSIPGPRRYGHRARWSDRLLQPRVLVGAGLILALGVVIAAVVTGGDGGGTSVTESELRFACVALDGSGEAIRAPSGCADDTPVVVATASDPSGCPSRTEASRWADDPDVVVCLVDSG